MRRVPVAIALVRNVAFGHAVQCSHVTGRDADYQPRVGDFHQHHPLALPHLATRR